MVEKVVKVKVEGDFSSKELAGLHGVSHKEQEVNEVVPGSSDEAKKEQEKQTKAINEVQKAMNIGVDVVGGILGGTFDIVQQMYQKLKASSPLLESVESLFNLAMTLLFMPLGNALGETFIPVAIELIDNIISLWDLFDAQFNNGDLSAMLGTLITTGVSLVGDFIEGIGESLRDQGGILGGIGRILDKIGEFIQDGLINAIELVLKVMETVMEHIKLIVSVFVGFVAASKAMDMIKIGLMITNTEVVAAGLAALSIGASEAIAQIGIASSIGAGATALATGAVASVATYGALTAVGLAEGGYVPPSPSGQLVHIAERGEGEYIIPESKINNVTNSSAKQITNNFYGYTQEDLIQTVRDVLRDEVQSTRYQTGSL